MPVSAKHPGPRQWVILACHVEVAVNFDQSYNASGIIGAWRGLEEATVVRYYELKRTAKHRSALNGDSGV